MNQQETTNNNNQTRVLLSKSSENISDISQREKFINNILVPLTKISGSSSLFMESVMGKEDWHPIESEACGKVGHIV